MKQGKKWAAVLLTLAMTVTNFAFVQPTREVVAEDSQVNIQGENTQGSTDKTTESVDPSKTQASTDSTTGAVQDPITEKEKTDTQVRADEPTTEKATIKKEERTVVYANGTPITIKEDGGVTKVLWGDNQSIIIDADTVIYGGGKVVAGKSVNYPDTSITMESGTVYRINGGNRIVGNFAGDTTTKSLNETVNIKVTGGTVTEEICGTDMSAALGSAVLNDGRYKDFQVKNCTIDMTAGTANSISGTVSYTSMDNLKIVTGKDAVINERIVAGGTNGFVNEVTLEHNGTLKGHLSSTYRAMVQKSTMNINGTVGDFYAGSFYDPTAETYDVSNGWKGWGAGSVDYGQVVDSTINISKSASFNDMYGGFQYVDYDKFVETYSNSATYLAGIKPEDTKLVVNAQVDPSNPQGYVDGFSFTQKSVPSTVTWNDFVASRTPTKATENIRGEQRTVVYANGTPVTIKEINGVTNVCWGEDKTIPITEKDVVIGGGLVKAGTTVNYPETSITMESGKLYRISGSNRISGNFKTDATTTSINKNVNITVTGGQVVEEVGGIDMSAALNSNALQNERYKDFRIENCNIDVKAGTVNSISGTVSYTYIDKLKITTGKDAVINERIVAGGTNGFVNEVTLEHNGTLKGHLSSTYRAMVNKSTLNVYGSVGPIYAGSFYRPTEETYAATNGWTGWAVGDVDYGQVKESVINISKDASYDDIYTGFQYLDYDKFIAKYGDVTKTYLAGIDGRNAPLTINAEVEPSKPGAYVDGVRFTAGSIPTCVKLNMVVTKPVTIVPQEEVQELNDILAARLLNHKTNEEIPGIHKDVVKLIEAAVKENKTITVAPVIETKNAEEIPVQDKNKIQNAMPEEAKVATYLDLGVAIKADNAELGRASATPTQIEFTVQLPDSLLKENREFSVLRLHEGEVEELETTLHDNKIKFKTDKFSTYAVVYKDIVETTASTSTTTPTASTSTTTPTASTSTTTPTASTSTTTPTASTSTTAPTTAKPTPTTAKATTATKKSTTPTYTAKSTRKIKVSWTKKKGTKGYVIYVKAGKGKYKKLITVGNVASKTVYLKAGYSYKFKVRPYKNVKKNGKTSKKYYKMYTAKDKNQGKTVSVTYKNIKGYTGYVIQVKVGNKAYKTAKTFTKGGTLSYKTTKGIVGKAYKFRLRGYKVVKGKKQYTTISARKS